MTNPLDTYISCARFVFSVEPAEPSEEWDEFDDFEQKLREFYESILCIHCKSLLKDPCTPKKQYFSCQHRVCLDCIGKGRQTTATNCKMCRDFTLFEKSTQTKVILGLYQELCELIRGSWIYDYIQRRVDPDTGQETSRDALSAIIEKGINYGRSIKVDIEDDSSSSSSSSSSSRSSSSSSSSSSPPPQSSGDDENSFDNNKQRLSERPTAATVPITSQTTFPKISILSSSSSPLPPVSPNLSSISVQSPEQAPTTTPAVCPSTPAPPQLIPPPPPPPPLPIVVPTNVTVPPQIVHQYQPQTPSTSVVQSQLAGAGQLKQAPIPNQQQLLKTSSFISHVPMRVKSLAQAPTPMNTKSIMSPMKIQQSAPTIYSVMYTGSGNKITLKRKTLDESFPSPAPGAVVASSSSTINTASSSEIKHTTSSNINLLKTETKTLNFKTPSVQVVTTTGSLYQQSHQTVVQTSTTNLNSITASSQLSNFINNTGSSSNNHSSSSSNITNDQQKRRGCRCGNATAAPGKLTCCGQRCPCYVDSKACIDCKCRGCRNPHYVDGHKKMRHQVPDLQQQQQQQQNFLASIQHQTAMLKEAHKTIVSTTPLVKSDEMGLLDSPTIIAKSQNSINNCIISMNSNGQYQIKPRIIMKDHPSKATMSPLIFPTASSTAIANTNNSSIQILGLYSQVPMANDKKILIKNEIPATSSISFTDPSRQQQQHQQQQQHLLDSNSSFANSNL